MFVSKVKYGFIFTFFIHQIYRILKQVGLGIDFNFNWFKLNEEFLLLTMQCEGMNICTFQLLKMRFTLIFISMYI